MSFRIMPRQDPYDGREPTRYGFLIEDYPRGRRLVHWIDLDKAVAAAHCLGISPYTIETVHMIYKEDFVYDRSSSDR